jgi:hypothetical protein
MEGILNEVKEGFYMLHFVMLYEGMKLESN